MQRFCKCGAPAKVQYSFGVYAGRMCDQCASEKYRDKCGHRPEGQGTQAEIDEPIEPEPYYGSEWP